MITTLSKTYRRPLLALVISSLLLSACDEGSDSSSTTTLTGSLKTPRITNLAYQGSQGSNGHTNDAGEFVCKAGETLSFTLGKTVLGTATCQVGSTSLMQMVGGGLTTQNALQEMQRAGGTLEVLPYDQWINRLRLLAELDSNGTLSDGIQLPTELDKTTYLKNNTLNFNQDTTLFTTQVAQVYRTALAARVYQRAMLKVSEGTIIKGLEAESLGALKFPGYMPVNETEDSKQFTYHWDTQGFLPLMTAKDGNTLTTEVDSQGRTIKYVTTTAYGKEETINTWDNYNQLTQVNTALYNTKGVKQSTLIEKYQYDANYFMLQSEEVKTTIATNTVTTVRTIYTYNESSQLKTIAETNTTLVNGVVDATQNTSTHIQYVRDANGNVISTTQDNFDHNGYSTGKVLIQAKYNAYGLITERSYQAFDLNNNVKASNKTVNTYNTAGYITASTRSYQVKNQDIGYYKEVYQYETGKQRLLRTVRAHYNPTYSSGTKPTRLMELNATYNEKSLPTRLEKKITDYQDGQGNTLSTPAVSSTIKTFTYDTHYNPLTIKTDSNGDGVFEITRQLNWAALASIGNADLIDHFKITMLAEAIQTNPTSEEGVELDLTPTLLACPYSAPILDEMGPSGPEPDCHSNPAKLPNAAS